MSGTSLSSIRIISTIAHCHSGVDEGDVATPFPAVLAVQRTYVEGGAPGSDAEGRVSQEKVQATDGHVESSGSSARHQAGVDAGVHSESTGVHVHGAEQAGVVDAETQRALDGAPEGEGEGAVADLDLVQPQGLGGGLHHLHAELRPLQVGVPQAKLCRARAPPTSVSRAEPGGRVPDLGHQHCRPGRLRV